MRIVHLIDNDRKYLPHVLDLMEAVNPGENRIVASPTSAGVMSDLRGGGPLATPTSPEDFLEAAQAALQGAQAVFVHNMKRIAAKALEAAPKRAAVVWLQWGADVVAAVPALKDQQFLPRTYVASGRTRTLRLVRRLMGTQGRALARRLPGGTIGPGWLRRVAPRIDLYCGIEPTPGIAAALPGFSARWLPEFKYYDASSALEPGPARMEGPDVLVGNRATPSCNHLETFDLLEAAGFQGRIFLPLSYGPTAYADLVETEARSRFGDRAQPIRHWMPIERYFELLGGCGTVLMNLRRGQALGTTAMALHKGARVFLRSDNPHFRHYRGHGATVFAIDRSEDMELLGQPLTPAAQARNREIVGQMYSPEAVRARAREIMEAAAQITANQHDGPAQVRESMAGS